MSKTILIVDDSASVRQVVSIALRDAGYQVIEAHDGADALAKMQQKVHLVISDVNMPVMDGISFVTALKEKAQYRFTPVLMLTTEAGENMKQRGKAAGVKAWLVKPFRPELLLSAVSKLA